MFVACFWSKPWKSKNLQTPIDQKLKVKIIKIDKDTNRVSASIKALTENPYDNIEKYMGEIYEGQVIKIMDYDVLLKLKKELRDWYIVPNLTGIIKI